MNNCFKYPLLPVKKKTGENNNIYKELVKINTCVNVTEQEDFS